MLQELMLHDISLNDLIVIWSDVNATMTPEEAGLDSKL